MCRMTQPTPPLRNDQLCSCTRSRCMCEKHCAIACGAKLYLVRAKIPTTCLGVKFPCPTTFLLYFQGWDAKSSGRLMSTGASPLSDRRAGRASDTTMGKRQTFTADVCAGGQEQGYARCGQTEVRGVPVRLMRYYPVAARK